MLSANAPQGLQDTLAVLAEHLPASPAPDLADKMRLLQKRLQTLKRGDLPHTRAAALCAVEEIRPNGGALAESLPTGTGVEDELYYWAHAFDRQVDALLDELRSGAGNRAQAQLERIEHSANPRSELA